MCIHQPVTDETIQKHAAYLFEKLDAQHCGSITLDDFVKFCLRVSRLLMKMISYICIYLSLIFI